MQVSLTQEQRFFDNSIGHVPLTLWQELQTYEVDFYLTAIKDIVAYASANSLLADMDKKVSATLTTIQEKLLETHVIDPESFKDTGQFNFNSFDTRFLTTILDETVELSECVLSGHAKGNLGNETLEEMLLDMAQLMVDDNLFEH